MSGLLIVVATGVSILGLIFSIKLPFVGWCFIAKRPAVSVEGNPITSVNVYAFRGHHFGDGLLSRVL